jgi:hypothetical protein
VAELGGATVVVRAPPVGKDEQRGREEGAGLGELNQEMERRRLSAVGR